MPDASHIRAVYDRYVELFNHGDVDGIVDLYAADATIEDPVGAEVRVGHAAIREFYEASAGTMTLRRTGLVRVAASQGACPLVILMGPAGKQRALDIISVTTYDEVGKIASMRAWWSFDDLRPLDAEA